MTHLYLENFPLWMYHILEIELTLPITNILVLVIIISRDIISPLCLEKFIKTYPDSTFHIIEVKSHKAVNIYPNQGSGNV